MKKLITIVLALILCFSCFGCQNTSAQDNFTRLKFEDLTASGNAAIKIATDTDNVPVGVGQDNPPETETYIITFNGTYSAGSVTLDKSKIIAGDYLTFTYYYNRTCTPTFLNLMLLRIKGTVERESASFGKFTVRHYDSNGKFIAGVYKDDEMINNNLKNNYLTLEFYFETAPSEDLKFGCVWLNNGNPANFYITDIRVSRQSLMQTAA